MIKPVEQLVSIDSSVWIDYFKKNTKDKYNDLDDLICYNLVAVCEPVIAEILAGSKNQKRYEQYEYFMKANIILETPDDIWFHLAEARYKLLRKGYDVHFLDLWIAYSAYYARTYLWTLDKHFNIIQSVIPFEFYPFSGQ